MLKWDKSELVSFFGVTPSFFEDAWSYTFEVQQGDLRLLVTLFEQDGAVYVSVFHQDSSKALFTIWREDCSHAHVVNKTDALSCFEAGTPDRPVTDMGMPPVLTWGVRVYLEPHFQVELIE